MAIQALTRRDVVVRNGPNARYESELAQGIPLGTAEFYRGKYIDCGLVRRDGVEYYLTEYEPPEK